MGLFGSIGSFFSTAAKAVATGGISLVAPKLIPKFIDQPLTALTKAQFPTSIQSLTSTGLAVATKNPSFLLPGPSSSLVPYGAQGGQPMAFNIGQFLGNLGGILGQNQNIPGAQTLGGLATLTSQFLPQPVAQRMPPMITPPISPRGMLPRVGGAIGRSFFNRFPNLAAVLQAWRDRGIRVTRGQLWSMLKRWGPEILVSGGIITAAAVSELMVAGPGHRRMNAGNAKALHRSLRRLEAFHRLCTRADKFRGSRKRSKPCKTGSGQQFVRQG